MKSSRLRSLRQVVKEQGRSYLWLAKQSGYSDEHVARVARGDNDGSVAFHTAMERILGERYDWPKSVKRPEDGAAA